MTYTDEEIMEAKKHIADNFSRDEQLALKQLAQRLRQPMNRKTRRAMMSQARRGKLTV